MSTLNIADRKQGILVTLAATVLCEMMGGWHIATDGRLALLGPTRNTTQPDVPPRFSLYVIFSPSTEKISPTRAYQVRTGLHASNEYNTPKLVISLPLSLPPSIKILTRAEDDTKFLGSSFPPRSPLSRKRNGNKTYLLIGSRGVFWSGNFVKI